MSVKIKSGLILIMLLGILSGCGHRDKATPAGAMQMPPTNVSAVQVIAKDVPVYIDEIGKCAAPEIVSIQPQVSGKIVEIHFKEGQDVKKGDKLFTIDPRPYEATLAQMVADNELNKAALEQSEAALGQYKAQLEEAKAVLAQSRTRQELNELELDRAKGLVASKAVAQQELDSRTMMVKAGRDQIAADTAAIARAEAQIRSGASMVNMSRAKIGSTEAMITSAKINLGYTMIYSPIDGRTGKRMTDVGNVVNSGMTMGSSAPLVVVQRMDPLYVDFTVPEMDLARTKASLAAGMLKAQCRAPEEGGAQREGDVVFLDSSVQDGSGTVKLRASIPNADRAFWPGQFVKIKLILATKKNAPMVPTTAPQVGQTGPFVYVVGPRPDPMVVNFPVPETEFAKVKDFLMLGAVKAKFSSPSGFEGTVGFGDPEPAPGNGKVNLKVTIPNRKKDGAAVPNPALMSAAPTAEDFMMKIGDLVNFSVAVDGMTPDGKKLPAISLGDFGPLPVMGSLAVELRPIKLGQKHGDLVAVEEGLKVGEQVVTAGQMMLYPEAKVNVEKPVDKPDMKAPAKAEVKVAETPSAEKTGGGK